MDARVTASQRRKGTRKADGIDQSLYKRAGLPGPFREFDIVFVIGSSAVIACFVSLEVRSCIPANPATIKNCF
jgi:hypothetical protein